MLPPPPSAGSLTSCASAGLTERGVSPPGGVARALVERDFLCAGSGLPSCLTSALLLDELSLTTSFSSLGISSQNLVGGEGLYLVLCVDKSVQTAPIPGVFLCVRLDGVYGGGGGGWGAHWRGAYPMVLKSSSGGT